MFQKVKFLQGKSFTLKMLQQSKPSVCFLIHLCCNNSEKVVTMLENIDCFLNAQQYLNQITILFSKKNPFFLENCELLNHKFTHLFL